MAWEQNEPAQHSGNGVQGLCAGSKGRAPFEVIMLERSPAVKGSARGICLTSEVFGIIIENGYTTYYLIINFQPPSYSSVP